MDTTTTTASSITTHNNHHGVVHHHHVGDCNRRLSRAAREIIRRQLQGYLQLKQLQQQQQQHPRSTSSSSSSTNYRDWTVWDLLDHVFLERRGNTTTTAADSISVVCPLLQPDVLRNDEEHSIAIRAEWSLRLESAMPHRKRNNNRQQDLYRRQQQQGQGQQGHTQYYWYKCGYCQKTFSTRYYLDQHLDRAHSATNRPPPPVDDYSKNSSAGSLICPATDWCPLLGNPVLCEDVALELEPYYAAGSGGWGDDAQTVARHVAESVPDCVEEASTTDAAATHCFEVMAVACLGYAVNDTDNQIRDTAYDDDQQYLIQTLCAHHTTTCAQRWQQRMMWRNHHGSLYHNNWYDACALYIKYHHGEVIAGAILVGVVLFLPIWHWQQQQQQRNKKRLYLLRKPQKLPSWSSLRSSDGAVATTATTTNNNNNKVKHS